MESALANVDLGRYRRLVQMIWDPEPLNNIDPSQPVWCLGCSYQLPDPASEADNLGKEVDITSTAGATDKGRLRDQGSGSSQNPGVAGPERSDQSKPSDPLSTAGQIDPTESNGWPTAFIEDFSAKFWMTYRSEFEPIAKSTDPKAASVLSFSTRLRNQLSGDQQGFSSDTGWGCMIRSGQSLLANAIARLRLGRDWRRGGTVEAEKEIISLFADDIRSPYSIHNFVRHGALACGKFPGEWFGPSATARCIQALANAKEESLRVYCTGDGPDVFEQDFMRIAKPDGTDFHPTLILVSTRLGIDKITRVYWEALVAALQMPQSMGIAGGRPSSSHYFLGAQGAFLFYLDPHQTRPALPYHPEPVFYTQNDVDSCHTRRLRRIHVREVDPSMLIGFLIHSEEDWKDWRRGVQHVQGKSIIHVSDSDPGKADTPGNGYGAIDQVETLSDDEM